MSGKFGEKVNKTLSAVSEMNCDSVLARRKIKGVFLERDKMQMSSYIRDLEKTVSINKGIIAELLSTSKQEGLSKKVITNLNQENARLQSQLKSAIKQRDSFQARLLITEQIIEDYKGKEGNCEYRAHEKAQELLDQLNRKEYVVQSYERRFHRIIPALRKYADSDEEVKKLLKEFNIDVREERKITNLVEQNAVLATEIKTARMKMVELENKVTELAKGNDNTVSLVGGIVPGDSATQEKQLVCRPAPLGSATVRVQQAEQVNKSLQTQIRQLQEENELVKDALRAMQKKNEELSAGLQAARDETTRLKLETKELLNAREQTAAPKKGKKNISAGIVALRPW